MTLTLATRIQPGGGSGSPLQPGVEAHGQGSLVGCGPRGRKEADASGHTARTVPGAVPSTGVNHPSNITPSNTQHTAGREGTASSPLDRRWGGGCTEPPAAEDTGWSKLKPRPSGHCPPPPRPPSRCLPAGTQSGQLCPWARTCCFVPGSRRNPVRPALPLGTHLPLRPQVP